jgi:hypothetical protein
MNLKYSDTLLDCCMTDALEHRSTASIFLIRMALLPFSPNRELQKQDLQAKV